MLIPFMIVSHSHKFIFVRTRKVASSALEAVLARYLSPSDFATRQSERERASGRLFPPCDSRVFGGFSRGLRPVLLYGHAPVTAALDLFGARVGGYTVFTVERNPWDRAVSAFYWSMRGRDIRSRPLPEQIAAFRAWLRRAARPGWQRRWLGINADRDLSQRRLYSIGDVAVADAILRYERLERDLAALSARLGLDPPASVADIRVKTESRAAASRDYTRFYDAESREIVAAHCRWEVEVLGYRFGGPAPAPFEPDPCRLVARRAYLAAVAGRGRQAGTSASPEIEPSRYARRS